MGIVDTWKEYQDLRPDIIPENSLSTGVYTIKWLLNQFLFPPPTTFDFPPRNEWRGVQNL